MRSRQRSQAVVEFGIVAITFTLIMFAIADFGLLLNDWLTVSSGVRTLARDAAVGAYSCSPAQCGATRADLWNETAALRIPGVTTDPYFTGGYCCTSTPPSALVLSVVYYDQCTPGVGVSCSEVAIATLDSFYSTNGVQGGCAHPCGLPNSHPSPPKGGACPPNPTCTGDSVVVTLKAAGAQV